ALNGQPLHHTNGVLPGMATCHSGRLVSIVRLCGIRSSLVFRACCHVTFLPVYADIRPMMAVSVLSATCLSSLSGLPERMLSIRSVCSWTYGSTLSPPAMRLPLIV